MTHVLVLSAARPLSDATVDLVWRALDGWGMTPRRLGDRAVEIGVSEPDRALSAVRAALADRPVDVNVLPVARRRKSLLIADMDSTIIQCECIDELADTVGLKDKVSEITERAMRGELDFAAALDARVEMLKGMDIGVVDAVYADRVRLTPGARAMVRTMAANGAVTALVSGGFTVFTEKVARDAGFAQHKANVLETDGDTLTGTVARPIVDKSTKLDTLNALLAAHGLTMADALAIGDGANDAAMVGAAEGGGGLGVAFRAKPILEQVATAQIRHGDLETALYLQGYTDAEIVRD